MGFLVKGVKTTQTAERISQFQTATCQFGQGVPIAYGTVKFAPQVIGYQDFQSVEKRTSVKTGKHSSSTTVDYSYYCYLELGLCEGVIDGFGRVWLSDTVYESIDKLNATNTEGAPLSYNRGNDPSASAYMRQNHANIACQYDNLARVYGKIYLGTNSASVPSYSFELYGILRSSGDGTDANVASVIKDMLQRVGMGAYIDNTSWQNYYNYCKAADWLISTPAGKFDSQNTAQSYIEELLDLTNTYMVWSNGSYKFIPRDDRSYPGWTPNKTIVFDLNHDDLAKYNNGVVSVTRKDSTEQYNYIQVNFTNRANQYETETISYQNASDIKANGIRKQEVNADWIHTKARAVKLAETKARIANTEKNEYTFQLGWKYGVLEPGDLIRISDPTIGLNNQVVMIREVSQDAKGLLTIVAIQRAPGNYSAAQFEIVDEYQYIDLNIVPSNTKTPLFITPPADITTSPTGVEVWIALQGSDSKWGGCAVYASNEDTGYEFYCNHTVNSNYGKTTSSLTETGDSVTVKFANSNTVALALGTNLSAAADRGATRVWLDGEVFSYTRCDLVAANTYTFSGLRRGEMSTHPFGHDAGANFALLDGNLCCVYLDKSAIGQTAFFKFPSFNVFGKNQQPVAETPSYSTVIQAYDIPNVTNITTQSRYLDNYGSGYYPRYDIIVSWTPPEWTKYSCAEVYYKCTGTSVAYAQDGVTILDAQQAGYAAKWQSAGQGYNTCTIPQCMVGETYKIAVCTRDIYGFTETPDSSSQVEIIVASKTEIPNAPTNLTITYGAFPTLNWDYVYNADVKYYEVWTGPHQTGVLLARTNGNTAAVELSERKGTLYVCAVSVFEKVSSDASVTYNFPEPALPTRARAYTSLGILSVEMQILPITCHAYHLWINDEVFTVSEPYFTMPVESGNYQVKYAFVDYFGEGPMSVPIVVSVTKEIDESLIKEESITKDRLDASLQAVLDKAANQESVNSRLEGLINTNKNNIVSLQADNRLHAAGITNNANEIDTVVASVFAAKTSIAENKQTSRQIENRVAETENNILSHQSLIDQTASSITSIVQDLNGDPKVSKYSAIQQLDNAIGLRVVDTDLTGKELVSRINISPDTIAIDGKYVHITGDTLFDDDVLIKGKMVAGSIECNDGLVIHGGAATISKDGISIATSNDETISLSEHGITFSDSNGFIYSGMGRTAMGHISATHPHDTSYSVEYHRVNFPHRMTTIPSVVVIPQQISFPESWGIDGSMYAFAPAYSCGVKDITTEGFTAWCYGSYAVPLAYSYYLNTSAAGAHPTYYRTCSRKGTENTGYTDPMRIEMNLAPYITRIEAQFRISVPAIIKSCKYKIRCDIIRASDGKKINTINDVIPANKMDWEYFFSVNTPLPKESQRTRIYFDFTFEVEYNSYSDMMYVYNAIGCYGYVSGINPVETAFVSIDSTEDGTVLSQPIKNGGFTWIAVERPQN